MKEIEKRQLKMAIFEGIGFGLGASLVAIIISLLGLNLLQKMLYKTFVYTQPPS